jgi:hypothetical protein
MVCPRTFKAAIPVGAMTAIFFLVVSLKSWSKVDLPVPAFPVIKYDSLVCSSKARQFLKSAVSASGSNLPEDNTLNIFVKYIDIDR